MQHVLSECRGWYSQAGRFTSRVGHILEHETSADLWNIGSLQLALAEARPVKVCKPWVHLHISGSPLERTQALVGVLDQEAPDQVSEILHTVILYLALSMGFRSPCVLLKAIGAMNMICSFEGCAVRKEACMRMCYSQHQ